MNAANSGDTAAQDAAYPLAYDELERWSLGPLPLPHPLVRVVIAEQLYRTVSLRGNHPYHRE